MSRSPSGGNWRSTAVHMAAWRTHSVVSASIVAGSIRMERRLASISGSSRLLVRGVIVRSGCGRYLTHVGPTEAASSRRSPGCGGQERGLGRDLLGRRARPEDLPGSGIVGSTWLATGVSPGPVTFRAASCERTVWLRAARMTAWVRRTLPADSRVEVAKSRCCAASRSTGIWPVAWGSRRAATEREALTVLCEQPAAVWWLRLGRRAGRR